MKPFLRITRHPYEEPDNLNLVVVADKGQIQADLAVYVGAEDLAVVAKSLCRLPPRSAQEFLWEIGSEDPEDRWADYYRFRVRPVSG